MKNSVKAVVASALAIASVSAFADTVNVPQGPGPIPLAGDSNAGGVLLAAWDEVRGISVSQYLNIQMDDIQVGQLTPSGGLTLDFGNIDLSAFGGNLSGVIYNVTAGDYFGPDPSAWQVSFTGSLTQAPVLGSNGDLMANALGNLNNFQRFLNTACGATVPCVATNSSQAQYAGGSSYGHTLGNSLLFDSTGAIGSALSFWTLTSTSDLGGDDATLTRYANASGLGQWLLDSNGHLTYSIAGTAPVPLPAAVWLLLSGLGGLGVVSRRRSKVAA